MFNRLIEKYPDIYRTWREIYLKEIEEKK